MHPAEALALRQGKRRIGQSRSRDSLVRAFGPALPGLYRDGKRGYMISGATVTAKSIVIGGFGAVLTRLTPEQADYIKVSPDGPYKPDSYKY